MDPNRRKLFALICALTLWPNAALARVRRGGAHVGVLLPTQDDDVTKTLLSRFKRRLAELGWREGSNIHYTVRYAEGKAANYERHAGEAVAAQPDLVFVSFAPFVAVVQKHTRDIPIVFVTSHDPVAEGLVASLAKPGGNATGVSTRSRELVGKRLELMKDVLPSVSTIGVVRLAGRASGEDVIPLIQELTRAAARLRLKVVEVNHDYRKAGAFAPAFAQLRAARVDAVATVLNWNYPHHTDFVKHANQAQMPTICDAAEFVEAGGLMSFAASYEERWAKSAEYVDRILRGAKAADLPVEEPRVFEFTINLKTAEALGLTIPNSVLLRADRLIR